MMTGVDVPDMYENKPQYVSLLSPLPIVYNLSFNTAFFARIILTVTLHL